MTPALKCLLLTGKQPTEPIYGWVGLAQGGADDAALRDAWAQHAEMLTEEAESHGFQAWGATRRRPTGPAVAAWSAAFLQAHRRPVPAPAPAAAAKVN